jgi:phage shock protein PspC (stress-responsive transcriptional regulator)
MMTSSGKPKLCRTSKGSLVSGVCSGLEASGRGNAVAYRILFVVFGLYIAGVIGYFIMALFIPKATPEEEEEYHTQNALGGRATSSIDKIKVDLERIQEMKDSGLITGEEYSAMRKKILEV